MVRLKGVLQPVIGQLPGTPAAELFRFSVLLNFLLSLFSAIGNPDVLHTMPLQASLAMCAAQQNRRLVVLMARRLLVLTAQEAGGADGQKVAGVDSTGGWWC
jgi:hypothetical protein